MEIKPQSERSALALPLIIVLGVVTAFDAMGIDLYLPAFDDIGRSLGADAGALQASLAAFLIGLAVGQIFYGPLTDRFGRRAPLVAGLLLFVAASAIVALAQDMTTFMTGRVLQGVGGAAGLVIPRVIIADLYRPREAAKAFSLLMQVMMIAPIIAPPIGGMLLSLAGWQAIFWTLVIVGALGVAATLWIVPESLPLEARRKAGVASALVTFAGLLRQGRFTAYMLSGAFTMAAMFVYIGSSSFIFVDHFGLSPTTFSFVFAGIAAGLMAVGFLNVRLLNRWTERQILPVGLLIQAVLAALLAGAVLAGFTDLYIVGGVLFALLASMSLIFGNGVAVVMESAGEDGGSASSLLGVVQYAFGGAVGVLLGVLHDDTLRPVVLVLLGCSVSALLFWWIAARLEPSHRAPSA